MWKLVQRAISKYKLRILKIFVFALLTPIVTNAIPQLYQEIINNGILRSDVKLIVFYTCIMIVLYALQNFLSWKTKEIVIDISLKSVSEIKKEVVEAVINMPLSYHDNNSSQYIINRINEVDNLSNLFSSEVITAIVSSLTALVSFVIICSKSIILALISVLLMPLFFVITNRTIGNMSEQIKSAFESSAKVNEELHADVSGTYILKQFNDESNAIKRISTKIDKLVLNLQARNLTMNKSMNLISFITSANQCIILAVVAIIITNGKMNIGDYVSLTQYISLLFAPLLSFQSIKINLKPAFVAYKRLKEFNLLKTKDMSYKTKIHEISTICFENLSFRYDNMNTNVLNNICISLKRGEKLLVKGANGSGKTTFAGLILGLYDTYEGNIYIDSKEMRNLEIGSIRNCITVLPQKTFLFNTSVRDNIAIANRYLTEQELNEKVEHYYKIGLLDGIDINEKIIENGKTLSGGQIQRIALARLLTRDTDICIFDEFTNSIDTDTRKLINDIIELELDNKMCIIISHDESVINRKYNKILNL